MAAILDVLVVSPARFGSRLFRLVRTPLRRLSPLRLLRGGKLTDVGRLPRYLWLFMLGAGVIWAPIGGYLATAKKHYTSQMSLILPGSGASASVNLDQMGQASSSAASPFSSSTLSPTETYKRLLTADRILVAAGRQMDLTLKAYGVPKVQLVDQTGLIRLDIVGDSPEDAQARGRALLSAFFTELDALRHDEQARRSDSQSNAISDYQSSVAATRAEVSRLQHETGLVSSQQYGTMVGDNDRLRAQLADLEVQYAEKSRSVAEMEAKLGLSADLAAVTLRLQADAEYAALVTQFSEASSALTTARADYGPGHPLRVTAELRFATARARVLAYASGLTGLGQQDLEKIDFTHVDDRTGLLAALVTSASDERGMFARLTALRAQAEASQARLHGLIDAAARLEDGERNFRVAETVMASAVARSRSAQADLYASYPLVQILEDPSLPDAPSSPKRLLALAAGGAATVFLIVGLTLSWIRRPLIDRILTRPAEVAP